MSCPYNFPAAGVLHVAPRGFLFPSRLSAGGNPSLVAVEPAAFLFNQLEITELCLPARKSFSRTTNPIQAYSSP